MTPYEAAVLINAAVGDPGLMGPVWPGHPSGLMPTVLALLHDASRGDVWRDRSGEFWAPSITWPKPKVLACKHAGLVEISYSQAWDYSHAVLLTDLGRTVIDGTFVAKEPDLLDLLAAA